MTQASTWRQRGKSLEERFWEKVNKTPSCWLWTSALGSRGYGVFWVGDGISKFAHRVSYELTKGEIPPGLVVMHSCDNPKCVNPDHLSAGTSKDNSQDAVRKGRYRVGEANGGGGKLTADAVRAIKALQADGWGCSRLSKRFGTSRQTIKSIKRGRIWRHVHVE